MSLPPESVCYPSIEALKRTEKINQYRLSQSTTTAGQNPRGPPTSRTNDLVRYPSLPPHHTSYARAQPHIDRRRSRQSWVGASNRMGEDRRTPASKLVQATTLLASSVSQATTELDAKTGDWMARDSKIVVVEHDSMLTDGKTAEEAGAGGAENVGGNAETEREDGTGATDDKGEEVDEPEEAELITTSFSIPDDVLTKTKAKVGTRSADQYFRFSLYRGPDQKAVCVKYCRTKIETEHEVAHFVGHKAIGFDMEWPFPTPPGNGPAHVRFVSLIQLASQDRIVLIHLSLHSGTRPSDVIGPNLRSILADKSILKLGVNVGGDASRLKRYLNVDVKGCFELSHLFRLVRYGVSNPRQVNKKLVGLSKQCQDVLGLPLSKDNHVRCSRWQNPLSQSQIVYAASDAYVGIMIFLELDCQRRLMKPHPPLPASLESNKPIILPPPQDVKTETPKAELEAADCADLEEYTQAVLDDAARPAGLEDLVEAALDDSDSEWLAAGTAPEEAGDPAGNSKPMFKLPTVTMAEIDGPEDGQPNTTRPRTGSMTSLSSSDSWWNDAAEWWDNHKRDSLLRDKDC